MTLQQKRLTKDVLGYWLNITGLSEDAFILTVQRNKSKVKDTLAYNDWLAVMIYEQLSSNGVTLSDCLEFRNLGKQLKEETILTPNSDSWCEVLCTEIQNQMRKIKNLLYVDARYLSETPSVLPQTPELVELVDNCKEYIDWLNLFDFDDYNKLFLNKMPYSLRKALIENKPIFISLNPYETKLPEVGFLYEEMRAKGFGAKKYQTVFFAYLFRLMLLKQEYKLTNLYFGIYGGTDLFGEDGKYSDFYKLLISIFEFKKGFCFPPHLSGISVKQNLLSYTIWGNKESLNASVPVVLHEYVYTEGKLHRGKEVLIRGKRELLYNWCNIPCEVYGEMTQIPKLDNIRTLSEDTTVRSFNTLGYSLDSANALLSQRKVGITSLPMGSNIPILEENFLKILASFAARDCVLEKSSQELIVFNMPDTTIPGYQSWLSDALALFLFSPNSMAKAYRTPKWQLPNKLFPFSIVEIRKYVKDEELMRDMDNMVADNLFLLRTTSEMTKNMGRAAIDLFTFCKKLLVESLNNRSNCGYADGLSAWDASFYQIRNIKGFLTQEDELKYSYLLSKLRDTLYDRLYTYGFLSVQPEQTDS